FMYVIFFLLKTVTTSSTRSTNVDDGKKKSLLKDNSWIRTNVKEEEQVDPQDQTSKTESKASTVSTSSGATVQALSKRLASYKTDDCSFSSTSTTTTIKDGTKITETTVTTTNDYKTEVITVKSSKDTVDGPTSPVKTTTSIKTYTKGDVSPTKTTSYSVRSTKSDYKTEVVTVKSSKDIINVDYKTEVITVKSSKDTVDGPTSPVKTTTSIKTYTKGDVSPTKTTSYSVRSTKRPTSPVKTTTSIKTYTKGDVSPTKTTTYSVRSTKSTEDQLFDTLIPTSIKSANTDSSREDVSVSKSIRTVYSTNERDEWSTVTSPSYSRTSYTESRPVDYLSDTLASKTTTTVYTSPERVVSGKDICTVCHKNMYTDEKMILDDMNINCHASCFKCGVCNASLGLLKAGDSLWVYRRAIHCESCFGVTKGKTHSTLWKY
uniref:SLAIN motif-containing protein 1-like n=1 Tax=Sinocyclocheilus anshuiensis TaxID=1608454 RepID=A0A671QWG6_9TELE